MGVEGSAQVKRARNELMNLIRDSCSEVSPAISHLPPKIIRVGTVNDIRTFLSNLDNGHTKLRHPMTL